VQAGNNPAFTLTANSSDITATVQGRFVSLRLTDETGNTSDELEVTLTDHDPTQPIALPPTGAALQLSLGYADTGITSMGSFIVDEIGWQGPPDRLIITARAAAYDQGNDGAYHLQTQKVRSWKAGTTIDAMVQKVASEHGMTGVVDSTLSGIALPHVDQQDESDLNMLLRIAKKYDAVVKPNGSQLVFAKRGQFKSASGKSIPPITIDKSDCTTYGYHQQKRESAGTIVAYYHAVKEAQRHIVSAGSGEPVRRIKQYFQTQAEAKAAAQAELARRSRAMQMFHITMPGRPDASAEGQVILTGFRPDIPTSWIAKTVTHELGGDGYSVSIELEQPDASQQNDVTDTVDGDTTDNSGDSDSAQ
jgi:phage protein D